MSEKDRWKWETNENDYDSGVLVVLAWNWTL